jgi:hypothetical protein
MIEWLKAHRGRAEIVGALLCVVAGYLVHRNASTVTEVATTAASSASAAHTSTTTDAAATHSVKVDFQPIPFLPAATPAVVVNTARAPDNCFCRPVVVPCGGAPIEGPPGERISSITLTDEGPARTTTTRDEAAGTQTESRVERKVEPEGLPRLTAFYAPQVRPSLGLGVAGLDLRLTRDIAVIGWVGRGEQWAGGLGVRFTIF